MLGYITVIILGIRIIWLFTAIVIFQVNSKYNGAESVNQSNRNEPTHANRTVKTDGN